jgi:hypothetical protein
MAATRAVALEDGSGAVKLEGGFGQQLKIAAAALGGVLETVTKSEVGLSAVWLLSTSLEDL